MSEELQLEIRTLRSLLGSARDPGGRAFAPLADAYLRAGQTKEALDVLNEGIAKHPDFATGHVVAAKLYLGQGMHSEAELAARRVLELDGENVVALDSLATALEAGGGGDEAARLRAQLAELEPGAGTGGAGALPGPATETAPELVEPEPVEPEPAGATEGLINVGTGTGIVFPSFPGADESTSEGAETPEAAPPDAEAPAPFDDAMDDLAEGMSFTLDAEVETEEADALPMLDVDAGAAGEEADPLPMLDVEAETSFEEADPLPMLDADPVVTPAPFESVGSEPEADAGTFDALPELPELPELAEPGAPEGAFADPAGLDPVAEEVTFGSLEELPDEVVGLDELAPDSPDDEVTFDSLGAVPDEVVGLDMLAPDPAAEEVTFGSLEDLPEPAVEDAIGMDALAPDSEPMAEGVVGLDALAPDPEPWAGETVSLDALAPDPLPGAEDAIGLDALAPDPEPMAEGVIGLDALAPDPVPGTDDAIGLDELAPDPVGGEVTFGSLDELPDPSVEDTVGLDTLAPDPVGADVGPRALSPEEFRAERSGPEEPPAPTPPSTPGAPVWTRTLAELYVKQGFVDKALDVLRHLQSENPESGDIADRIAELERGDFEAGSAAPPEEEVETLARDLAESGHGEHDVDTPFAWTESDAESEAESADEGPAIGRYFDGLLEWEPREPS